MLQVLRDVDSLLAVNGDAIYGTRPWKVYGEGPTKVAAGSFHDTDTPPTQPRTSATTKGNNLYAIELGWPVNLEAVIQTLATAVGGQKVESAALLGSGVKRQFRQQPDALHIRLPGPPGKYAYVFRVVFGNAAQ